MIKRRLFQYNPSSTSPFNQTKTHRTHTTFPIMQFQRLLRQSARPISHLLFKSASPQIANHSISNPFFFPPKPSTQLTSINPYPNFSNHPNFSSQSNPGTDHNKEIDEINLKFAEAREEIETAMEAKESVYFDEEAECARDAVEEVLDLFNGLLGKLPESEKSAVQRSMGLKIEQLKAELEQLNE